MTRDELEGLADATTAMIVATLGEEFRLEEEAQERMGSIVYPIVEATLIDLALAQLRPLRPE